MTLPRFWVAAGGILLALSLGGNLLLAGVLIGRDIGEGPRMGFLKVLPGAPEEARSTLRRTFRQHREEIRTHFNAHRQARARVAEVLAAPEFDVEEFDRALADLAEATSQLQGSAHAIVREAALDMPAETRRAWGESWEHDRKRRRHRDHR